VTLVNKKGKRPGESNNITVFAITTGSGLFTPSQNCVGTLAAGKRCKVAVKFAPVAPGTFIDQLTISSNAANGAIRQVNLTGIATQRR
jgi:hypothetical protein